MEKFTAKMSIGKPTRNGNIYSPECFEQFKGVEVPVVEFNDIETSNLDYLDNVEFVGVGKITDIDDESVTFSGKINKEVLLKDARVVPCGIGVKCTDGEIADYEFRCLNLTDVGDPEISTEFCKEE